ncbi:MAG: hypothetical protein Tp172MES00d2C118482111_29 [Prokaryotic dsDNA virus sp.]|nr:MAG: hypothetical protein Tp172MES00d2C118482111_29 [Prokaryotic dsDNA virus sp.]|tara:strand:- start:576 stop:1163 length:588 start_codon:yes stop_codon:yes gene_type:complete
MSRRAYTRDQSIEIDGEWYAGVDYEPPRISLGQALNIFAENIPDIKEACQLNILHIVQSHPKDPADRGSPQANWVAEELRQFIVKRDVEHYHKTLKRIASIEAHKRNPYKESITDAMIERAREHPIEDFCPTELRKAGRKLVGCCPLHNERTPSFYVHEDNRWSCFGACSAHGDAIDLYQRLNDCSFKDAVSKLQ